MSVNSLSKMQPDLLTADSLNALSHMPPLDDSKEVNDRTAYRKKDLEAPKRLLTNRNDHQLLTESSRMCKTVADVVDERRTVGGNAFAEHFIRELKSASQINRGPPGISNGSNLHWDILLGRDETIEPCDYLNFEFDAKF